MAIIVMKFHNLRLNSNKWRDLTINYTCNTIKPWRIALGLARERHLNPGEVTFVFWSRTIMCLKGENPVGKKWVENLKGKKKHGVVLESRNKRKRQHPDPRGRRIWTAELTKP